MGERPSRGTGAEEAASRKRIDGMHFGGKARGARGAGHTWSSEEQEAGLGQY